MKKIVGLRGVLMFVLMFSATVLPGATEFKIPAVWSGLLKKAEGAGARQIVFALTNAAKETKAEVFCLELQNGSWSLNLGPFDASVGRKGIADPEKKREGDGCSPYGVFRLGMSYGYGPTLATKMHYQQMFEDDIWIDDPAAPDYNRLAKKTATKAKSFEYMKRKDDLYEAGIVVEYNTDPVIPGNGSAIFVHFWGKPFRPTAGCLGLSKENLAAVLQFLDPELKPFIAFVRKDKL